MKKLIRMLVLSARIIGSPGLLIALITLTIFADVCITTLSESLLLTMVRGIGAVIQLTCMGMVMLLALQAQLRLYAARMRLLWKCAAMVRKANEKLDADYLAAREKLMAEKARVIGELDRLHRGRNDEGEGWKRGEKQ